jgi:hypothetical protein
MPLGGVPIVHPGLLTHVDWLFPQTVTIQRNAGSTRDAYGSPIEDWDDLTGHVNIPARVVSNGPGTGAGGWSGMQYAPDGEFDVDGRTMSLRGYYPTITELDRVVVDGEIHEIQAAESDAQSAMTRLRTRKVR